MGLRISASLLTSVLTEGDADNVLVSAHNPQKVLEKSNKALWSCVGRRMLERTLGALVPASSAWL